MKFYLAPMEGITGYHYRNVYHQVFDDVDKYFTPFIMPHIKRSFDTRELREILPEHNVGMNVVPQILTNQAEDFIRVAKEIHEYGYREVNLNLGCPSKTVVSNRKGAGFLAYPEELDMFLDKIFRALPELEISVKTRMGMDEPEEFWHLLEICNQYPISELTIHPRVQSDYYKNPVRLEELQEMYPKCRNTVVYNGDIVSKAGLDDIEGRFPEIDRVMIGRGIIANPCLVSWLRYGEVYSKDKIHQFHDLLYEDYRQILSGDKNVLFRMKELWAYMLTAFLDSEKYGKKIRKCQRCTEYELIVKSLFHDLELCREK